MTLDSLQLPRLHFMKIDVEGSHVPLLRGARQTIERCRPRIWIELRPDTEEYETGAALLAEYGYREREKLSRSNYIFEPV